MAKIVGIHTPSKLRNYAINGNLDFWQRVGANTTTINTATTSAFYSADRIKTQSGGATVKNYSVGRSTNVPTMVQSGFSSVYSFLFTMVTGIASPASGDYLIPFQYNLEGYDYQRIHGRNITVGFWVKASVAGTYNFMASNGAFTRCYVTTFSVNAPNTWEFKSVTIALESSGSYNFDATLGLQFNIGSYGGVTVQTGVAGWQAGNLFVSTASTNWMATTGATFQVAQFSILEGNQGLGATGFIRAGETLSEELMMCQRYYEKSYEVDVAPGTITSTGCLQYRSATTNDLWAIFLKAVKRAIPTTTFYNASTGATGTWRNQNTSADLAIASGGFTGSGSSILASNITGTTAGNGVAGHFVADSDF